MESKFFIESFSSKLLSLINIDDSPSLVGVPIVITVSGVHNKLLAFFILCGINLNNLVVSWVHKEFTLELEYLEPI